jgi:enoyl-[acyl-carrier protein] reductase I
MRAEPLRPILQGTRAVVSGIANEHSIAYGCAAAFRQLGAELGPKAIRVHAISPGPLKTRAASGLKGFDLLLDQAMERAPLGDLVDIMDVGFACAYLATPYARRITGTTMYVDGGVNIMA